MKKIKSRGIIITAAALVLLVCVGLAVYTRHIDSIKNNPNVAKLSQLSGLEQEKVVRLYRAVGDWDKLLANIMLYKELVSAAEGKKAEKLLFRLLPHYQTADLYTAFDYFTTNSLPLERVEEVLDQRAAGEDWSNILANCSIPPQYENYRVVEEEELRRLLAKGCLPEDIVRADEIARAGDLRLEDVLKLKTGENTWDDIAGSLGVRTGKSRQNPSLTVPAVDNAVPGRGLEAVAAASKQEYGERKINEETLVKDELGLSDEQMDTYLSRGFNPWEVNNAYKLARANNVGPEEILARKKAGQSWEDILATYPKK